MFYASWQERSKVLFSDYNFVISISVLLLLTLVYTNVYLSIQ